MLDLGFIRISAAQLVSIILIVLLTFVNTRGVEGGKIIQSVFTVTKIASLFGLIIFGFVMLNKQVWDLNWTNAWSIHGLNSDGSVKEYLYCWRHLVLLLPRWMDPFLAVMHGIMLHSSEVR